MRRRRKRWLRRCDTSRRHVGEKSKSNLSPICGVQAESRLKNRLTPMPRATPRRRLGAKMISCRSCKSRRGVGPFQTRDADEFGFWIADFGLLIADEA